MDKKTQDFFFFIPILETSAWKLENPPLMNHT